jgi:D-proline reductase (dithiol) PrdB
MPVAAEHDVPIPYMQRTRDYYQALGFPPYHWAHFAEVPFTPLASTQIWLSFLYRSMPTYSMAGPLLVRL